MSFEEKDKPKIIEGYIPVTGGNIWYKIVGINGKKIPVLVLHGGPGAPHDYLEPFEILSDERPVTFLINSVVVTQINLEMHHFGTSSVS